VRYGRFLVPHQDFWCRTTRVWCRTTHRSCGTTDECCRTRISRAARPAELISRRRGVVRHDAWSCDTRNPGAARLILVSHDSRSGKRTVEESCGTRKSGAARLGSGAARLQGRAAGLRGRAAGLVVVPHDSASCGGIGVRSTVFSLPRDTHDDDGNLRRGRLKTVNLTPHVRQCAGPERWRPAGWPGGVPPPRLLRKCLFCAAAQGWRRGTPPSQPAGRQRSDVPRPTPGTSETPPSCGRTRVRVLPTPPPSRPRCRRSRRARGSGSCRRGGRWPGGRRRIRRFRCAT
jgi:hypothetical protein